MDTRIDRALIRVKSGKLTRNELENLRKNALRIGGAEQVVEACDQILSKLPLAKKGGIRKTSSTIAESKNGYNIMSSAFDTNGKLLKPELLSVADELVTNPFVKDISVLKTQLKLYYKGRHFTAGCISKGPTFWVTILDETKVTDSTIKAWEKHRVELTSILSMLV